MLYEVITILHLGHQRPQNDVIAGGMKSVGRHASRVNVEVDVHLTALEDQLQWRYIELAIKHFDFV